MRRCLGGVEEGGGDARSVQHHSNQTLLPPKLKQDELVLLKTDTNINTLKLLRQKLQAGLGR